MVIQGALKYLMHLFSSVQRKKNLNKSFLMLDYFFYLIALRYVENKAINSYFRVNFINCFGVGIDTKKTINFNECSI